MIFKVFLFNIYGRGKIIVVVAEIDQCDPFFQRQDPVRGIIRQGQGRIFDNSSGFQIGGMGLYHGVIAS